MPAHTAISARLAITFAVYYATGPRGFPSRGALGSREVRAAPLASPSRPSTDDENGSSRENHPPIRMSALTLLPLVFTPCTMLCRRCRGHRKYQGHQRHHTGVLLLRSNRARVLILRRDHAGALLLWNGRAGVALLWHEIVMPDKYYSDSIMLEYYYSSTAMLE